MNFFQDCANVQEIKIRFRELAKIHHPDHGGNEETMKTLNSQYHEALKKGHGQKTMGNDGQEHTYFYNESIEKEVQEIILKLLSLKMNGADIYLIGTWVWVNGMTKQYKEQLKALGLRWHSQHLSWYFKPSGSFSRRSGKSLDEIACVYGAKKIIERDNKQLTKV
jgi:curved DNA-binding protein CbpA